MIDMSEIVCNDVLWQMSVAEKAAILYLISKMPKRSVAIEIGSYCGGFTRVLSKNFDKVYSLDIDHSNIVSREQFQNVKWVEGDSKKTLPGLIKHINKSKEDVNLILIDADHSFDAVYKDIKNVLHYVPKSDTVLLLHDSWYAPSRDAISLSHWNSSPYVHYIEKDFVCGDVIRNMFMGGLALVIMSSVERKGAVEIKQTHDYMYTLCSNFL